jgi:hypothetical protein
LEAIEELWAGANPQHRTATRKLLLLLVARRVVFTIGDLLNKGTAVLSRPDEGPSELEKRLAWSDEPQVRFQAAWSAPDLTATGTDGTLV